RRPTSPNPAGDSRSSSSARNSAGQTNMRPTFRFALIALFTPAAAFAADPYPAGSIAFFNTADCPAGWSLYTPLVGRTVLPYPPEAAGEVLGTPLPSRGEPS